MKVEEFFDPYELRARFAPSIIVSLPLVITVFAALKHFAEDLLSFLGAGAFLVAASYGFSFIVRRFGKSIEDDMWVEWDGAPSVRFVRWRDSKYGKQLKEQIHTAVTSVCGIQLMTKEDEAQDPSAADKLIADAFSQVRSILRARNKDGLWYRHVSEYGFTRNLLGSRSLFLFFSVLGILLCGALTWYFRENVFVVAMLLNLGFVAISITLGWWVLPSIVKGCADTYAESAWMSFVNLSRNPRVHGQ